MNQHDLIEAAGRLRGALTPAALDDTLTQITTAAVEVLPDVSHASITIKHTDGRLETAAPTADIICDLDAAQYSFREGPCYEAAVESVHVSAPDLAQDTRWPHYAPVAVAAGMRAQAAIRLYEGVDSNAALNLYAESPGAFADLGVLGQLFSHQAAMALDYAREISHLKQAVETRQLIGQAVGVVMHQYGLDDARAFAFLTRMASTSQTKLRVVAEELLRKHQGGLT